MIVHAAEGGEAARSGTGIPAAIVVAGKVHGTVRVDGALGSTVGRCTQTVRLTGARGQSTVIVAIRVEPTRRGHTGVLLYHRWLRHRVVIVADCGGGGNDFRFER